jgi:hypothetical protein
MAATFFYPRGVQLALAICRENILAKNNIFSYNKGNKK